MSSIRNICYNNEIKTKLKNNKICNNPPPDPAIGHHNVLLSTSLIGHFLDIAQPSIIRGPSSESAWSPIVSVMFFFFLKFCRSQNLPIPRVGNP